MIPVLFFVSGFCALTYEIVWQRLFVQLVGSTTLATCLVLCLFMAGMALGALDFYLVRDRFKNKLLLFAVLEAVIGLFGLLSTFLSSKLESVYFSLIKTLAPYAGIEIQSTFLWLLVFLILLIPTMCMGATLPVLAGWAREHSDNPQSYTNRLYAVNTLGAFCGTIFGGIILAGWLGLNTTLFIAFLLNMIVAALAFANARSDASSTSSSNSTTSTDKKISRLTDILFFFSVFVSGLACLALEVIWTKYLVVFFGSSTYSLASVIAVCVFAIAASAFTTDLLAGKQKTNLHTLALVLMIAALTLSFCLHQYNWTPYVYLTLLKFSGTEFSARMLTMVLTTIWLVFLPAAATAAIFPLAINYTRNRENSEIEGSVAKLWIFNIAGCVTGSILVYMIFDRDLTHLFVSSIQISTLWLVLLLVITGLLAQLVRLQQERENKRNLSVFLSLIIATTLLLVTRPDWKPELMTVGYSFIPQEILKDHKVRQIIDFQASGTQIEFYREAANSVVCVKRDRANNITYLSTNGKNEASIPINRNSPCPMSDLKTHTLMGLSAAIFCPNNNQESMVIGYGSGTTCGTALQADWVKSVDVVEIDESIFSIDPFFQPANLSPLKIDNLKSGRLKPIVADARNYLNLTDKKFDTIVSQPAEPWITGSSNLYTEEFFKLARSRLKEGGVMCQWIQLYSIDKSGLASLIKTFYKSFEKNCLILHSNNAGEIIMLGFTETPHISLKNVDERVSRDAVSNVLASIGIHSASQFIAEIIYCPEEIEELIGDGDITINTDDNLYSELSMGKNTSASDKSIAELTNWFSLENKSFDPARTKGITSILNLDREEKLENVRFLSRLAFATLDKNHTAFRPYSDRELVNRYGLVDVKDQYRITPRSLARIKNLLDDINTIDDGLYHQVTSARLHQMINGKDKNSDLLKEAYLSLRSKKMITSDISDSYIDANLAYFYLNDNNNEKAISHALKVENCDQYSIELAGKVLLYTGQLEESIKRLQNASKIRSNSNQALSCLALALVLSGRKSNSTISLLESSLAIDPNQYIARYLLGRALFQEGKLSLCLHEMLKASKVSFTDASPNLFVTAAFEKIHHWKNARLNLINLKKKQPASIFLLPLEYSIIKGSGKKSALSSIEDKITKELGFMPSEEKMKLLNNLILESPTPKDMLVNTRQKVKELSVSN